MNLLKALATISSLTLVSRILAFVRDMLIARIFGAGMATDAFFVAFRLPNLLRRLFAEGAFSQAFVPIFGEYKNRKGHDETKLLVDHVVTLLAIILFVVTPHRHHRRAHCWCTLPRRASSTRRGQIRAHGAVVAHHFALYILHLAGRGGGGILNTYNKFWVPAFAPILLNICFIGGALWLAPYCNPPIMALGWAVFSAGIVQLAFQVPVPEKDRHVADLAPGPEGRGRVAHHPADGAGGVRRIHRADQPDHQHHLRLLSGGGQRLLAVLRRPPDGVPLRAAGGGARHHPAALACPSTTPTIRPEEYSRLLDWGLRLVFMLALPAALALGMMAVPLIWRRFSSMAHSPRMMCWMTRNALAGYSVGLIGLISVKVLAPGFYARQDIRTPVKIGIGTLFATQAMNLLFVFGLQLHHAGLALSIGLGSCLNSGHAVLLAAETRHLPARTRLARLPAQDRRRHGGDGPGLVGGPWDRRMPGCMAG